MSLSLSAAGSAWRFQFAARNGKLRAMFLMSYFRTEAEALHFALSEDGFHWRELNENRPVFQSSIGSKTLRDPFTFRDQNGVFHLLSTNGWKSDAIYHAVSDDCIAWRHETLLPVMQSVPETRNCWAPEAFFARESGLYWLIWSSTTPKSSGPANAHGYNHRIWGVSTADFQTFSDAQLFFDPGYNVIDTSVLPLESGYIIAFKDERGDHSRDSKHKAIRIARAQTPLGPWQVEEAFVSPLFTEGPTLFRTENEFLMLFDHFIEGFFGAIATSDLRNWRDVTHLVRFPDAPRHAGVSEIDAQTARALEAHWKKGT